MHLLRTRLLTLVLLALGIAFNLVVHPDWTFAASAAVAAGAAALAVLSIAKARSAFVSAADWLRALGPRGRMIGVLVVAAAWVALTITLNAFDHYPFQLLWHDERQFHLQSQMLARGRLWMAEHPIGDFFDTFYVLMTPKYAPQSFPGAALMFVPTVWLSLPTWVMPLLVSAAAVGLMWWVIGDIADPAAATVAVVTLIGCSGFRRLSTMYLAQVPALLLGLIAVAAWLQYRRSGRLPWVGVIGAALGWGLITRPLDAACYGLVVGAGVIVVWCRQRPAHVAKAVVIGVVCAMPFVGLQLTFNHAITGSWTKSPFTFYNERDQPALAFGATGDTTRAPLSKVPQKSWFYDAFTLGFIRRANDGAGFFAHAQDRINMIVPLVAPSLWAIPLLFVGLAAVRSWRQVAVLSLLVLYFTAYGWYPIYLSHYIAFAVPAAMLLYGLAPQALAACAGAADRRWVEAAAAAALFGFVLADSYTHLALPDNYYPYDIEDITIRNQLAGMQRPGIVLFMPDPQMNMHQEPVYNDDVVWPDDAPLIKAHSLGKENPRLFAYYAARQPQRTVYLFDRRTNRVQRLGNVADLARQFPATQP